MIKEKTATELPLDIVRTVVSLCHDYARREREIARGEKEEGVLANYRRLNDAIDHALSLACEEGIRIPMREDIGLNRGHRMSPIYYISDKTYKLRKRLAKYEIARALELI